MNTACYILFAFLHRDFRHLPRENHKCQIDCLLKLGYHFICILHFYVNAPSTHQPSHHIYLLHVCLTATSPLLAPAPFPSQQPVTIIFRWVIFDKMCITGTQTIWRSVQRERWKILIPIRWRKWAHQGPGHLFLQLCKLVLPFIKWLQALVLVLFLQVFLFQVFQTL